MTKHGYWKCALVILEKGGINIQSLESSVWKGYLNSRENVVSQEKYVRVKIKPEDPVCAAGGKRRLGR